MAHTHADRVAIVTGAAAGIGQAVCVALASRGATVVGFDLDPAAETGHAVERHGARWLGLRGDVCLEDDVARLVTAADEEFGRVDILVNNAGIFPNIPFTEMTFADWRRVLATNLDSQFLTCSALVPIMQRGGWGRIVNLASSSVEVTHPGFVAYKASKLGIVGLTRGLAADVGSMGITVNAVSPSLTDTPGTHQTGAAGLLPTVSHLQAIPKIATPDDVLGAIMFLSSEESYFVTGQTLYSDGGLGYL